MDGNLWSQFWEHSSLWMAPMFMGTLCGVICGYLGPWIFFQRMSFFTLTLTQISSLGILLVHFVSFLLGMQISPSWGLVGPILLNVPICLVLAHMESRKRASLDHLTAALFVVCLSLTVVIGDRLPHSAYEMTQILFGSAVAVLKDDLVYLTPVLLFFFAVLLIGHQKILHVIFDPLMERVHGTKVTFYYLLLFLCFAMILGPSTKAVGALPVFAFTIFPSLAALRLFKSVKMIFFSNAAMGGLSYIIGLLLSFFFSLPSGAAVGLVAAAFYILSYLVTLANFFRQKINTTKYPKHQNVHKNQEHHSPQGDPLCSK